MKTKFAFLLAATLALGFVACSDDDDPPVPDKGTIKDTGPDPDKGPDPDVGDKDGVASDAPAGACTNAADWALLDDSTKRDGVTAKAGTCGQGCLGDPDPATCSTTCVVTETGLSQACSACYAAIILCAMQKCLAECAADPSSAACVTCRDTNCTPDFITCSGLPSSSDGGV